MPQAMVVHLHSVNALAHLVQENGLEAINKRMDNTLIYGFIDYFKPGDKLAQEIHRLLNKTPGTQVVFLKNHGIIVGGESPEELSNLVENIEHQYHITPITTNSSFTSNSSIETLKGTKYHFVRDTDIQKLVSQPHFYNRLSDSWAISPDHVVFLGARAFVYENIEQLLVDEVSHNNENQSLAFVKGHGVYSLHPLDKPTTAQLHCYIDIISRIPEEASISQLSENNISELLNWDSEIYRQQIQVNKQIG